MRGGDRDVGVNQLVRAGVDHARLGDDGVIGGRELVEERGFGTALEDGAAADAVLGREGDARAGMTARGADGHGIWAHENTISELAERGPHWQHRWFRDYADTDPTLADGLAAVRIVVPDHSVRTTAAIDLGGRVVTVTHPGYAHTSGDLYAIGR